MPRKKKPTKWESIAVEPEVKKRFEKQAEKRSQFIYEVAEDAIGCLEKDNKRSGK